MKHFITYFSLLLLISCGSNDRPAEIITPGSTSIIPNPIKTQTTNPYYLVKPGDTLLSVSTHFNIKPYDLLKLNKLPEGATLIPGQRILIKPRTPEEERLLANNSLLEQNSSETTGALNEQDIPLTDSMSQSLPGGVVNNSMQPVLSTGEYKTPVQGNILKSFGQQPDGSVSKGISIAAPKGVPVRAISDGMVKYVGTNAEGYGKMVMIKHTDGRTSIYAHLNSINVKPNTVVNTGTKIGTVGSTGNVSQPQLQLQIRNADKSPINPSTLISGLQ